MLTDSFWHHLLHQRLGETLHYYFLDLQPFEPNKISSHLEQLIIDKALGDVHCYKLFGRYDLLVRAWLHPNIVHSFPGWLRETLKSCVVLRQFDVNTIDYAWYNLNSTVSDDRQILLKNLSEENIKAVQEGDASALRERLTKADLLLCSDQTRASAIKFFVAVELDRPQEGQEETIAQQIISYLRSDVDLFNEAVYHGHGDCDILVKAQGNNFFAISRLPNWIGENFRGARTETYFSHDPLHMIGSGTIGKSTFNEIRGRDLFAQSIVPELYSGDRLILPNRKEEVEHFLRGEAPTIDIDSDFRIFMHEYAMGYLQDRSTDMLKTLFEFFTAIEEYLRKNREQFVARLLEREAKFVYEKVGLSDAEKRKYPPLGTLFLVYSEALKSSKDYDDRDIEGHWDELVHLRNQTAHGALDPGENWAGTVHILLRHYHRLRQLLETVGRITGESFQGRFF